MYWNVFGKQLVITYSSYWRAVNNTPRCFTHTLAASCLINVTPIVDGKPDMLQ